MLLAAIVLVLAPSMKVPPKRKGNTTPEFTSTSPKSLNESPSEKEGKWLTLGTNPNAVEALNESPSEKEGKS